MEVDVKGKVVLVTGGGSGLGEATARAFGRAGCAVAVVDVRASAAERVSKELAAENIESLPLQCDVSDADGVFETVAAVIERFGRIDVIVNNAAVDHTVSVDEMTIEQWDQVIAVNLRGPFLLTKAALPTMRQQQYGHIINIASTAATRAWANASAYHATKWGIVGFGRALGVEGRPDNIRVTTIIPGGMRTHFFDRFEAQGIPMPDMEKLQDPANVAETMLFAVRMPLQSALQEVIVTPLNETSWP
ncbi:MAG: short-chain dehydrogenase [Chloroflexi bacterium]|nr:MAG: short-chain dehydrogenase [Chloroflexota bacterium]